MKGTRRIAYFLACGGAINLALAIIDYRSEGILGSRGVHVDAKATASIETHQHSDNIPSHYYHLDVSYPVASSIWRKQFSVSYEAYRLYLKRTTADVIYDPADPGRAFLAEEVRGSNNSRYELLIGLGFAAASWWMFRHSKHEAGEAARKASP